MYHIHTNVSMLGETFKYCAPIALAAAAIGPVLIVVGKSMSAVGTIMTIIPKLAGVIGVVQKVFMALNGIKYCISAVGDAVSAVADKIKPFLHFSVPDEGPLTDY